MSNIDAATERELASSRLWKLEPEALTRWESCKASHRFMSFKDKSLIIYQLVAGKPVTREVLQCQALGASLEAGVYSTWEDKDGCSLQLSSAPVEVYDGIFLWHTFGSDLQYVPYRQVFGLRFSMILRSQYHPDHIVEGANYIQELAAFKLAYPL
jgi:hypothetical protein